MVRGDVAGINHICPIAVLCLGLRGRAVTVKRLIEAEIVFVGAGQQQTYKFTANLVQHAVWRYYQK